MTQPNMSSLFEAHTEKAERCVAGYGNVYILNRGNFRSYKASRASQARLDRVCQAFGNQVLPSQWDFPRFAECPEHVEKRQARRIRELGY